MFDAVLLFFCSKGFWFSILVAIVWLLYLKYVTFNYWKRKNIPHEEPVLLFGNVIRSSKGLMSIGEDVKRNYKLFCDHPIHGMYMLNVPILIINDPELIRLVLIKEFNKFRNRGLYFNDKIDPLTNNIFFQPGDKWKRLRSKFTPIFTFGKLKKIYPLIKEIGDELARAVSKSLEGSDIIEAKDLAARFTTDIIASLAFGCNSNSLNVVDSEFRKYGDMTIKKRPNLLLAFGMFSPAALTFLRVPLIPKPVFNFFSKTFADMIKYRKQENVQRNDLLSLLMQLIEKGEVEDNKDEKSPTDAPKDAITFIEACSQAFLFFFAGFETSSGTIAYGLYELSMNPEIQDKVHQEIDELLEKSDTFTFENCLNKMKYLEMVILETLRKHPSSPFLNRVCEEDCELPKVNFTIPKGMKILIPASGIMRNPKYYPDPDKFDPERFSPENVDRRSPYVYLPFGQGPRSCIGLRLGMIQVKVAFISLLSKYKFSPCDQTPIPLEYSAQSIVQVPANGIYLKVEERRKINQ